MEEPINGQGFKLVIPAFQPHAAGIRGHVEGIIGKMDGIGIGAIVLRGGAGCGKAVGLHTAHHSEVAHRAPGIKNPGLQNLFLHGGNHAAGFSPVVLTDIRRDSRIYRRRQTPLVGILGLSAYHVVILQVNTVQVRLDAVLEDGIRCPRVLWVVQGHPG
jgi:hypothetical protein